MISFKANDRVVRIPFVGPVSYGTVVAVSEDSAICIAWDSRPDDPVWYSQKELGDVYLIVLATAGDANA